MSCYGRVAARWVGHAVRVSETPGSPGPRSRGPRSDALRNHRLIVAAAREAIEESGASVPLEDVAKRAGVGMATIYRRFAGRDDLMRAVFEQFFTDEIEPLVTAALTEPDPWRGLVRALETAVAAVVEHEVLLQAARDAGVITVDVAAGFLEPVGELLRRAQRDGMVRADLDPADLPVLVTMAMTTVSKVSADTPGHQEGGAWRRYLAIVLDGIRAGAATGELPGR